MERHEVRALFDGDACSIARTVELIGDRWSMLILREAFYDITRFEQLRANLGISRAVLTDRLEKLVGSGLLERRPYQVDGMRAQDEYRLTEAGAALVPAFAALLAWGDTYCNDGAGPVALVHAGCGHEVTGHLVCGCGHDVAPEELEPVLRERAGRSGRTPGNPSAGGARSTVTR